MAQTFSQALSSARLLASGIRKNDMLANRGITTARADELEQRLRHIEGLDGEQESLKARLKDISEELRARTAELTAEVAKDTRIIKADVPQTLWKEFGIQAKS
ncbi:MAG: hypothetical protein LBU92_02140 [Prevotellaceae bacterium]|nr:hypothetical protein [Prevotellaceae bacterium]